MYAGSLIILSTCTNLVLSFHIPNFTLDSKVDVDASKHNSGLIHSTIKQNWSQSLNVGSVSIAATLCILFIALVMYLKLQERINGLVKCVLSIKNDLKSIHKKLSKETTEKILRTLKREFEAERTVSFIHLCEADPEGCLCQEVNIQVMVNTQFSEPSEVNDISSQPSNRTVTYYRSK